MGSASLRNAIRSFNPVEESVVVYSACDYRPGMLADYFFESATFLRSQPRDEAADCLLQVVSRPHITRPMLDDAFSAGHELKR